VAAVLLHQAIGKKNLLYFVNNGLLRKKRIPNVLDQYKEWFERKRRMLEVVFI
jgi:GMP synthase PP-ATPase subunit